MKIGIDLGTANVIVYVKGKGIVITEPSVVAVSDDNRIVAVGEEAREMIGRTPGNIHAIRPMKDGVIADYVITEAMLSHFIGKVRKGRVGFGKPEVMISVPAGAQGMNTGIQDAYNLGWKLAMETLLDTYESERKPVAEWLLGMTTEIMTSGLLNPKLPLRTLPMKWLSMASVIT